MCSSKRDEVIRRQAYGLWDSKSEKSMEREWTQESLQRYINEEIEESLNLDYKAADALAKTNRKRGEVTKDVSAMANSDGGVIIYGIKERPDQKYLPEKIIPVDRTLFSRNG